MFIYKKLLQFFSVVVLCSVLVNCQFIRSTTESLNEERDYMGKNFVPVKIPPNERMATPCVTPNCETAWCIEIQQCPALLRALQNPSATRNFLLESKCGPKNEDTRRPRVCCGKYENYHSQSCPDKNKTLLKECGKQNVTVNKKTVNTKIIPKILGGNETRIGEFPWLGKLIELKNNSKIYGCSAFLIHKKYLVTAAHCVMNKNVISVLLGVHNLHDHDSSEINIQKIFTHEDYSKSEQFNDIALLELRNKVSFSELVQPICVTPKKETATQYTLAGWGSTEEANFSKVKRKVSVPLFDHKDCKNKFRSLGNTITDTQICAGGEENKDSCSGDSGGPLMSVHNDGTWYAAGVVSYGAGCGRRGWPGVYTDISLYYDWISNIISTRQNKTESVPYAIRTS